MNKEAVIQAINDIQVGIYDYIDDINMGGCGVFAYYISKIVRKYGMYSRILATSGYESTSEFENKKRDFNRKFRQSLTCCHIYPTIIVDDEEIVFDASYWAEFSDYDKITCGPCSPDTIIGEYTYDEIRRAANTSRGWNKDYDRDQNEDLWEIIESAFKRHFEESH